MRGIVDRFSEDLDLTCDIRTLIPGLTGKEHAQNLGAVA